jgi:hypothetical protein
MVTTETKCRTLRQMLAEVSTRTAKVRAQFADLAERHGASSPLGHLLQALARKLRREFTQLLRKYRQVIQEVSQYVSDTHAYQAWMWLLHMILLVGGTLGAAVLRVGGPVAYGQKTAVRLLLVY